MSFWQWCRQWWDRLRKRWEPRRRLLILAGDILPARLPRRDVVLMRDEEEDWSVGLYCPCGCGEVIELLLIPEANPHWDITVDAQGFPSLYPSIWLNSGCRSHFWLRHGRVEWC